MDSNGRVKYRGRWFTIDKPTTSTRATKKKWFWRKNRDA